MARAVETMEWADADTRSWRNSEVRKVIKVQDMLERGNRVKLIDLQLVKAALQDSDMHLVSQLVTDCINLRSLNLNNNRITAHGIVFVTQALSTRLPQTNAFPQLKHLNCGNNQLGPKGTALLGKMLFNPVTDEGNDQLTHLDIACIYMTGFQGSCYEGIRAITRALTPIIDQGKHHRFNQSLIGLRIGSNRLSSESLMILISSLRYNTTLKELSLSYTPELGHSATSVWFLADSFFRDKRWSRLCTLDLTYCHLENGFAHVKGGSEHRNAWVTSDDENLVFLTRNGTEETSSECFCKYFEVMDEAKDYLRVIVPTLGIRWIEPNLYRKLNDEEEAKMNATLQTNASGLQKLILDENHLTSLHELVQAFNSMNTTLRALDLAGNCLAHVGTQAINLSPLYSVEQMTCSRNRLRSTEAFEHLLEITPQGTQKSNLTVLDLSNNSLGARGCIQLAACLSESLRRSSPTGDLYYLRKLDLRKNMIGDEGGRVLYSMLQTNKTLIELLITSSELDDVSLIEALENENGLYLGNIPLDQRTSRTIMEVLGCFLPESVVVTITELGAERCLRKVDMHTKCLW